MADTVIPTIMDIAGDHGWPGGEMPDTVIEALGILAGYISAGADPEVIADAVAEWLEAHPEATTTVQDGTITLAKLSPDLVATDEEGILLIDELADVIAAAHDAGMITDAQGIRMIDDILL